MISAGMTRVSQYTIPKKFPLGNSIQHDLRRRHSRDLEKKKDFIFSRTCLGKNSQGSQKVAWVTPVESNLHCQICFCLHTQTMTSKYQIILFFCNFWILISGFVFYSLVVAKGVHFFLSVGHSPRQLSTMSPAGKVDVSTQNGIQGLNLRAGPAMVRSPHPSCCHINDLHSWEMECFISVNSTLSYF